ncbi:MAG: hypothetical protein IJ593_11080 [Lachnospiraceae bacterium]|nr:hypothetical protein [Lachnospiraceae bacterium]
MKCEWCGSETVKIALADNLGQKYKICTKCNNARLNKICRKCGKPLGSHSVKGVCLICHQLDITNKNKVSDEVSEGVYAEDYAKTFDEDSVVILKGGLSIRDSYGNDRSKERAETRKKVLERFKDDGIFTDSNIEEYLDNLAYFYCYYREELKDKNCTVVRDIDLRRFNNCYIIESIDNLFLIKKSK